MSHPIAKKVRTGSRRLLSHARRMRHEPTDAERKFWMAVRGRQFGGYKFKRQYPIGSYIADFVCLEHSLIIKLDCGQHGLQENYDSERTAFLESRGFRVLRYWNDEFLRQPDVILEDVLHALSPPHPLANARDLSPKGAR